MAAKCVCECWCGFKDDSTSNILFLIREISIFPSCWIWIVHAAELCIEVCNTLESDVCAECLCELILSTETCIEVECVIEVLVVLCLV